MNSSKTFGVLDIGSGKIHCLIVQENKYEELEAIGYSSKPCTILNRGNIINIEVASKYIIDVVSAAELMAGVEVNSFYANIPGIVCNGVRSQGMIAISSKNGTKEVGMEDIDRVIEIAESTPIPKDNFIIHTLPIEFRVDGLKIDDPQGAVGMRLETDVYLLYCLTSVLDGITKSIRKSGYELEEIMAENVASAESVLSEEEKKSGSVVIDIGAEHTNVVQYFENSIFQSFSIPFGGNALTKDLAIGFRTSLVEAEDIKIKHGALDIDVIDENESITVKLIAYQKKTEVSKKAVFQIMEARMNEIFEIIKDEFRKSSVDISLGSSIVITGGTAQILGIDILAGKVFNQACRIGFPLGIKGLNQEVISPEFTTSLGIALVFGKNRRVQNNKDYEEGDDGVFKKIKNSFKNFFT